MCMKKGTWQSECVVHDILHEVDAGCGGEVLVVDGGWRMEQCHSALWANHLKG